MTPLSHRTRALLRRLLPAVIPLCALGPAAADELPLRPSARLIFKQPDFLKPGACVLYREGGAGWIMREPEFYLQGTVIAGNSEPRRLTACPAVPGKNPEHYDRAQFIRLAAAYPCLAAGEPDISVQVGVVRLRVERWETPHARRAANQGRLYRGQFLDRPLHAGMEIELEADLLETCTP